MHRTVGAAAAAQRDRRVVCDHRRWDAFSAARQLRAPPRRRSPALAQRALAVRYATTDVGLAVRGSHGCWCAQSAAWSLPNTDPRSPARARPSRFAPHVQVAARRAPPTCCAPRCSPFAQLPEQPRGGAHGHDPIRDFCALKNGIPVCATRPPSPVQRGSWRGAARAGKRAWLVPACARVCPASPALSVNRAPHPTRVPRVPNQVVTRQRAKGHHTNCPRDADKVETIVRAVANASHVCLRRGACGCEAGWLLAPRHLVTHRFSCAQVDQ